MRSNLITVVTAVASLVLVAQVAAADQVQEQFRLMEQRMAEMEDRLQATSTELESARATVDEQQSLLTDAGLVDASDAGLRSGVGSFFEMVDVSGVVATSYNYRLIDSSTNNTATSAGTATGGEGNRGLFKTPNGNTFQLDQAWVTLDKTPTDESRGGFHAEFFAGASANAQNGTGNDTVGIYSAYVSYLAPIGNGIQVDAGRVATGLGAEVIQTNGNFFITMGSVFGLQPVTYTGGTLTTQLTDELSLTAGVVNDVYSNTFIQGNKDLAYVGQLSYSGESFGLNVGGIWGRDSGNCGAGGTGDCMTSVVDVVLTAEPSENLSLWANFDWKHAGGDNATSRGDTLGVSAAGRLGITDTMGVATRVEYIHTEDSANGTTRDGELVTLTGTVDKTLAEGLVARFELRWDTVLDDNNNAAADFNFGNNDQLVALAQMYYEF